MQGGQTLPRPHHHDHILMGEAVTLMCNLSGSHVFARMACNRYRRRVSSVFLRPLLYV